MTDTGRGHACQRCEAPGQEGKYCTQCGYDLRPPEPVVVVPSHRRPVRAAEVVTCAACGAANAASRRTCARCQSPLRDVGMVPPPPVESSGFGPPVRARARARRGSPWLAGAVVLSVCIVLGLTAVVLAQRGIGPFGRADAPRGGPDVVALRVLRASSALGDAQPGRLVDGDPRTPWIEGMPGPGIGAWVDLALEGRAEVHRLLVWNGDQSSGAFARRNRVRGLQIRVGDERFSVELLDAEGPQAVELPRAVAADRIRLQIASAYGGQLGTETALSEVRVYRAPAG
jgi:hypothetical protein